MEPLTIGQIKTLLKSMPQSAVVEFDFCHITPTGVGSYRGFYNQPSLEYDPNFPCSLLEVSGLLDMLDDLTSLEYNGWKGGEYRYNDSQVLHVAECGKTSCTYIWNVSQIGKYCPKVILNTMYEED